jgi:hypothetical protein
MSLSSTLSVIFGGDSTAFNAAAKQVESKSQALGKDLMRMFSGVSAMMVVKQLAATADAIVDVSAMLGISTDALQKWEYGAKMSGAQAETLHTAIRKMNQNLGDIEPTQELKDALTQLGLSFEDLRMKSPEEAFKKITAAVAGMPDQLTKSATAAALFGRSGAVLLPMIDNMEELNRQAVEFGQVMGVDAVESLDRMQDHMNIATKFAQVSVAKIIVNWAELWDWLGQKSTGVSDEQIALFDAIAQRDKARSMEAARLAQRETELKEMNAKKQAKIDEKAAKDAEKAAKETEKQLEALYDKREKLSEELAKKQEELADQVTEHNRQQYMQQLKDQQESLDKHIDVLKSSLAAQLEILKDAEKAARESNDKITEQAKLPMAKRLQNLRNEERAAKEKAKEEQKLAKDTAEAMKRWEEDRHLSKWQNELVENELARRRVEWNADAMNDMQGRINGAEKDGKKARTEIADAERQHKKEQWENTVRDAKDAQREMLADLNDTNRDIAGLAPLNNIYGDQNIAGMTTPDYSNALTIGMPDKATLGINLAPVIDQLKIINETLKEITARAA